MRLLTLIICWASAILLIYTPYRVEGVDGYMPRLHQAWIGLMYVGMALLIIATGTEEDEDYE